MKLNKPGLCLIAVLSMVSAGCHTDLSPGDYDSAEVGKIKKVIPGTILSIRPVRLHSKTADTVTIDAQEPGNHMNRSRGFEYVIKLNSGAIISVVQSEDIKFKIKQRILVIYGKNTRVVPDNGSDDY